MKSKKLRAIVGVVVVLIVVIFVVRSLSSESFTADKWANATPAMRDRLLEGLARDGILVGLSDEVVVEMLGDPDGSSYGRAMYYFRNEGRSRPCLVLSFAHDYTVASESLSSMGRTTSTEAFDEKTWRAGSPAKRLSMVRDLVASDRLKGMSRSQLHECLGKPDRETPSGPTIWYTKRYYDESGELKKRNAGGSKCLYIEFRSQRVVKAEFKGS